MERPGVERKLTTILSADVAGYSRLMGRDEEETLRSLQACRTVIERLIENHHGRVFGTAGDSFIAEFGSAVEAVRCATEIQQEIEAFGQGAPEESRMRFRIGINLGDVLVEDRNLFGDGVNIAARLQGLAEPGGICISGSVYDQVEHKLPIGCAPLGPQRLKNIDDPVRAYRVTGEPSRAPGARSPPRWRAGRSLAIACVAAVLGLVAIGIYVVWLRPPAPAGPGRAMIAVLPFSNLSGDPAQDYFSAGLTEDIIAALGRFPELSVMAYQAVRRYRDSTPAPADISTDLGVRYVLEGSVRRDGNRVRVTAQLTDAPDGRNLWSDRYERALTDVFAVQDDITRSVAGALATKLIGLETQRAFAKPTANLAAYDYVLRGREFFAAETPSDNDQARRMFEKAVELDPAYASAYAALGQTWLAAAESGWTEFRREALDQAGRLADKAIALDDANPDGHALLGGVSLDHGQYERAIREQSRAIALNPSNAASHYDLAIVLAFTGHPEDSIAAFAASVRLNPSLADRVPGAVGWAYYLLGRYEEAVGKLVAVAPRNSQTLLIQGALAAAYAELGRADDAARSAAAVRTIWPFFEVDDFVVQFAGADDRARIAAGLRKAGLK
jgi:TolB-like protein/class 3 adenylate cyclase/Flp pilus assembly protein TadD